MPIRRDKAAQKDASQPDELLARRSGALVAVTTTPSPGRNAKDNWPSFVFPLGA